MRKKLSIENPALLYEWDYEQNTVDPSALTLKSNVKVWWVCKCGHKWKATVCNKVIGRGCPYCAGKKAIPGETDLLTIATYLAQEWDYERNTVNITDCTLRSSIKVWWICKHGHSWKARVCSRTMGSGCPYCGGRIIYKPKNVKGG